MTDASNGLQKKISEAIRFFWQTRFSQFEKQVKTGSRDQGTRGAVTGGAQMYGFVNLITEIIKCAGVDEKYVFFKQSLELPGYFRPTKEWAVKKKIWKACGCTPPR